MKLETTIKPRRDGTVNAVVSGVTYIFAADEQGRMVADVGDESHLSYLLGLGDFMPADEGDFEAAQALIAPDEDEEEDEDEVEADLMLPPVEDGTPPSGKKPRKVK